MKINYENRKKSKREGGNEKLKALITNNGVEGYFIFQYNLAIVDT